MTAKIETHYWAKPIPDRSCDWTATLDGYDAGDPIGYGATEAEAIADLKEQIEDKRDERIKQLEDDMAECAADGVDWDDELAAELNTLRREAR